MFRIFSQDFRLNIAHFRCLPGVQGVFKAPGLHCEAS
jgi:hypothetical protein